MLWVSRPGHMFKTKRLKSAKISTLFCIHCSNIKDGLTLTLVNKEGEIDIPIYFPEYKRSDKICIKEDEKLLEYANNISPTCRRFNYCEYIDIENNEEDDEDDEDCLGYLEDYNHIGEFVMVRPIKPFIPLVLFDALYLWNTYEVPINKYYGMQVMNMDTEFTDTDYETQAYWGGYEPIRLL